MSNIIANFSYYLIPDYEKGDSEGIEKSLSIWDERRFTVTPIGYYYNEEKKELRIPRGYNYSDLKRMTHREITVNKVPQEFDKIDIRLYQNPREDLQIRVISFLCGLGKYQHIEKHSQVFCDLNTGKGKTYCAIAAVSHLKTKVAIIIPSRLSSKLIPQWKESIIKYTNKKDRDILVVKGSDMCVDILKGKYKTKEFFIFSKGTILSFAKTNGWDKFEELMRVTKVGVKIVDEAHMDMHTNVLIDCHSNVKRNFYLTASAGRGDEWENKIFKRLFNMVPILGKDLTKKEDNYIVMFCYQFRHKPTQKQRIGCKTREGLSAALYSNYLVNKDGARLEFFTAFDKVMKNVFAPTRFKDKVLSGTESLGPYSRNETGHIKIFKKDTFKGKLLVLASTRELLRTIQKFLVANYPQYTIGMYTGDVDIKVRDKELENDIILATDKGMGTGADVDDLQVVINLIPYSNEISANQLPGRLRDIKRKVIYVEIVNIAFDEAASQYYRRMPFLSQKAKDGKIIHVTV
jgi:hypothetical protein